MPAYNEEAIIAESIKQWHNIVEKIGEDSRLVVFNDGSKDKTYEIMSGLVSSHPQLVPVDKPNSGHGPTCTFAYNYAINNGADFVFQTDSDGQTCPDDFWQFWEQRKSYDFIIGFRKNRKDGIMRVFVSKMLQFFVWFIFREKVSDPNTPFKLMRTDKLMSVIKIVPTDFFLSNVLINILAIKRKAKIAWLPITFLPRKSGSNSIKILGIFKIGLKAVGDLYKIKRTIKADPEFS
jgi:glycosyltransferase involved in cell wall biosynthesis